MYCHDNRSLPSLLNIISIILILINFTISQDDVSLDLGKVHPSLNLDGKKTFQPGDTTTTTTTPQTVLTTTSTQITSNNTSILTNQTTTTTTEKPNAIINITIFGFARCGSDNYCSNNGVCLVKLSNFTHKKCTCHKDWEGVTCGIKISEKEHQVMPSNYVVYALGILGGLVFLAAFAAGFHFYKKSETKKRRKLINKLKAKQEIAISFSNDDFAQSYKNPSYETDLSSQTDSSDSASKVGNNNRVFHFSLNSDKKESKISDHVIVEVDNDNDNINSQLASSLDSGNPLSEVDETDNSSDVFTSDRVTVTDRSDSPNSDESEPKRKQSMDDIYNEYYSRRLSYQMEMKAMEETHRKSVDMEVTADYNPYLYNTTPTRGRNNRNGRKVEQTYSTLSKANFKKVKANARTGGRQRKMSEDILRNSRPTILPPKITAMRSSSLGDLTAVVGNDYPYHDRNINDLSTFGGSTSNLSAGRKISQTALISPSNKPKGIWASTFDRD